MEQAHNKWCRFGERRIRAGRGYAASVKLVDCPFTAAADWL